MIPLVGNVKKNPVIIYQNLGLLKSCPPKQLVHYFISFLSPLQIALQYILEYPLGKLLNKHLEYYITQLSYEMEMGRESALEMLATIFSSFPQVYHLYTGNGIRYDGLALMIFKNIYM